MGWVVVVGEGSFVGGPNVKALQVLGSFLHCVFKDPWLAGGVPEEKKKC